MDTIKLTYSRAKDGTIHYEIRKHDGFIFGMPAWKPIEKGNLEEMKASFESSKYDGFRKIVEL